MYRPIVKQSIAFLGSIWPITSDFSLAPQIQAAQGGVDCGGSTSAVQSHRPRFKSWGAQQS
jgi:hypothetical protein